MPDETGLPPRPARAREARDAALSLTISATLFAIMALGARLLAARISGPQMAFVRFMVGVVVVAGAVVAGRAQLRPTRWGWLLARGGFGGVAVLTYFWCIERLGVGLATLLNYTAPVWSLLASWILLGERPRPAAAGALTLTLAGVALVVGADVRGLAGGAWSLVGVLSAVFSGIAVTTIRAVRRDSADGPPPEASWMVFASFTGVGALVTLPVVLGLFPAGGWVTPTGVEWALLLGVGLVSVGAQLIMTRALRHVSAHGTGIIHQLTIVLAMAGGVLLFGETLTPHAALGSVLTIAGVVLAVLRG